MQARQLHLRSLTFSLDPQVRKTTPNSLWDSGASCQEMSGTVVCTGKLCGSTSTGHSRSEGSRRRDTSFLNAKTTESLDAWAAVNRRQCQPDRLWVRRISAAWHATYPWCPHAACYESPSPPGQGIACVACFLESAEKTISVLPNALHDQSRGPPTWCGSSQNRAETGSYSIVGPGVAVGIGELTNGTGDRTLRSGRSCSSPQTPAPGRLSCQPLGRSPATHPCPARLKRRHTRGLRPRC